MVDALYAYWINDGTDGAVMRVPLDGGTPATIARTTCSEISAYQTVAVDSTNVYWTDYLNGRVMMTSKN